MFNKKNQIMQIWEDDSKLYLILSTQPINLSNIIISVIGPCKLKEQE